jgi:hypothetical protein
MALPSPDSIAERKSNRDRVPHLLTQNITANYREQHQTRLVFTGTNRFVSDQGDDHKRLLLLSQPSKAKLARGL